MIDPMAHAEPYPHYTPYEVKIPLWFKLFSLMFIQFFMITMNTTGIAHGSYLWTGLTDAVICLMGFTILKQVQASEDWADRVGYTLGGVCGAQAAIFAGHFIK